jgi:hypothetical protein
VVAIKGIVLFHRRNSGEQFWTEQRLPSHDDFKSNFHALGLFPDARDHMSHLPRLSSPSPIKLASWTELDRAIAMIGPSPIFWLVGQMSQPEPNSNGASQSAARPEH